MGLHKLMDETGFTLPPRAEHTWIEFFSLVKSLSNMVKPKAAFHSPTQKKELEKYFTSEVPNAFITNLVTANYLSTLHMWRILDQTPVLSLTERSRTLGWSRWQG